MFNFLPLGCIQYWCPIFILSKYEKTRFIIFYFLEFWNSIGSKQHLLATACGLQNGRFHGCKKLSVQWQTRIGLHQ